MKMIYRNFDGLDIAFQGKLPTEVLETLAEAKAEAQASKKDAGAELGPRKIPVMVGETGAKGGYKYRFDTGPDGETWMVADSQKTELWNIKVSVKSLALALHGYEGVKARVLALLEDLGATGPRVVDPVTKETTQRPRERVSRLDFCVDIQTDAAFQPEELRFIAHSHSGRTFQDGSADEPGTRTRRGRELESVRIGSMPNRQVAVYNKTREIVASGKGYWWKLWGLDKDGFAGRVWRVEARAGKDELNKWNLRTFADFEAKAGDVVLGILGAVRYVLPSETDTNPARWPDDPLWAIARETAADALAPYVSNVERREIIADLRAKVQETYRDQFKGLMPGYMVALGLDVSEVPTAVEQIVRDLEHSATYSPTKLVRRYDKAAQRYVFLDDAEPADEPKNGERNVT